MLLLGFVDRHKKNSVKNHFIWNLKGFSLSCQGPQNRKLCTEVRNWLRECRKNFKNILLQRESSLVSTSWDVSTTLPLYLYYSHDNLRMELFHEYCFSALLFAFISTAHLSEQAQTEHQQTAGWFIATQTSNIFVLFELGVCFTSNACDSFYNVRQWKGKDSVEKTQILHT